MSYRDTVLYTAYQEAAKPVHWARHEQRILDYFHVSTGKPTTKAAALQISWCSYFVHWCLVKGGMRVLPRAGAAGELGGMGSVGRFMKPSGGCYEAYGVYQRKYRPRPGDMYNRLKPNNHIGFIRDVREVGKGQYEILTIDGNSGPLGYSPYFDASNLIGKGFIYLRPEWVRLGGENWYIQLCEED